MPTKNNLLPYSVLARRCYLVYVQDWIIRISSTTDTSTITATTTTTTTTTTSTSNTSISISGSSSSINSSSISSNSSSTIMIVIVESGGIGNTTMCERGHSQRYFDIFRKEPS
jgi:hypothetical protein